MQLNPVLGKKLQDSTGLAQPQHCEFEQEPAYHILLFKDSPRSLDT